MDVNENKRMLIKTEKNHINGMDFPEKPIIKSEEVKEGALKQIVTKILRFINRDTIKILRIGILKNFRILIMSKIEIKE